MNAELSLDQLGWELRPLPEDAAWDGLTRFYEPLWQLAGRSSGTTSSGCGSFVRSGRAGQTGNSDVRDTVTVLGVGRRPFDPWEEIHEQGGADLALAFARLFWPAFVERQGCVLVEHRADEGAIADAFERSAGDPRAVEELLNRVALREEMPIEDSEIEDETLMEVGDIMRRSWTAALAEQFPGREFVLELLDWEDDYNGPTLYLTSGPRRDSPA